MDHKTRFVFPFAAVVLSVAGVLILAPELTVSDSQKCPDEFFIFVHIYASLILLIALNFYLNMLSLLLHATACAGALEPPSPVFLMGYLPRAACAMALTTVLIIAPLSIHMAVAKESISMAIGASLACLASVTILASVVNKLIVFRGFAPPLLSLCISTAFTIVFDPIIFITHKNQNDLLLIHHISIHFLFMFVSFLVFILGIALLLLRIGALADGQHAAIHAENLVIVSLSVSIATLLLGGYIMVCIALTDLGAGGVGAAGSVGI